MSSLVLGEHVGREAGRREMKAASHRAFQKFAKTEKEQQEERL